MKMLKRMLSIALCLALVLAAASVCLAEAGEDGYTLERMVVLSRHNIRSPLSTKGSAVSDLTDHEWFSWTSNAGELSLRGAMLETTMGQYFRLYLEQEGLFPENYLPEEGAVRFYANGLQRTQATAHYFSTGLLPVAVVPVERHVEYNGKDAVFLPLINFMTDAYARDVQAEIVEMGGGDDMNAWRDSQKDAIALIMDVLDMEQTEAYSAGTYGDLLADDCGVVLEVGEEPKATGPMKTLTSLVDALVLQYYEQPDEEKAAFGHALSREDWALIGGELGCHLRSLFTAPSLSVNLAHPMLEEMYAEMNEPGRKFSFLCGHDSTVASFLAALGAEEYTLPEAIEPLTPIGVKVVFERWLDGEGRAFWQVKLVYQSVDQLRSIQPLSLEIPPMIVPISFAGIEEDAQGYIPEEALMALFQEKIGALDELMEAYGEEELDAAA